MEIKATKRVEQEYIKDVICNKCGENCKSKHSGTRAGLQVCTDPDYPGNPTYYFHLCEKCTSELMKTFKIPAEEL